MGRALGDHQKASKQTNQGGGYPRRGRRGIASKSYTRYEGPPHLGVEAQLCQRHGQSDDAEKRPWRRVGAADLGLGLLQLTHLGVDCGEVICRRERGRVQSRVRAGGGRGSRGGDNLRGTLLQPQPTGNPRVVLRLYNGLLGPYLCI